MAFLTAIMFVGQVGMAFLPNIEIVSLLVILYTQLYRKKSVFDHLPLCVFGGCNIRIWNMVDQLPLYMEYIGGCGTFSSKETACSCVGCHFRYLWSLLWVFVCNSYYITGGAGAGFSYWVTGIPFDILHCVGNVGLLWFSINLSLRF